MEKCCKCGKILVHDFEKLDGICENCDIEIKFPKDEKLNIEKL